MFKQKPVWEILHRVILLDFRFYKNEIREDQYFSILNSVMDKRKSQAVSRGKFTVNIITVRLISLELSCSTVFFSGLINVASLFYLYKSLSPLLLV